MCDLIKREEKDLTPIEMLAEVILVSRPTAQRRMQNVEDYAISELRRLQNLHDVRIDSYLSKIFPPVDGQKQ